MPGDVYKRQLVDTAVIARAPVRLLVAGMGDALATWFEARTVIEAHRPNQLHGATTNTAGALARDVYKRQPLTLGPGSYEAPTLELGPGELDWLDGEDERMAQ